MAILAVNTGSSSLKFALYPLRDDGSIDEATLTGQVEGLQAGGQPRLVWRSGTLHESVPVAGGDGDAHERALLALQALLATTHAGSTVLAVAHRVVHGGTGFRDAVPVNADVIAKLEALCPLAPLHQPQNVQGIRRMAAHFPGALQVACFDTAFHADLPQTEQRFALPQALHDQGIRRYGFHGLSYQHLQAQLQRHSAHALQRVVMAHLGSGASLCATRDGRSQATTMGFSALDGLMMGTRCGSLDAGVILHLLQQGWTAERLQRLLYTESGLLGVSGMSADMRELRASAAPAAQQAIELFTHRVVREVGALSACLDGLDVIAFTGGIGENDAELRADVCAQLTHLDVMIDADKNQRAESGAALMVQAASSRVEVWVIPADEARVAAEAAAKLLAKRQDGEPAR
ncbi:MAG: acetate/propionate family kinase [Burkholderiales bacterium]|nr:acetate/propionate family kinase [Burkholderiales bacterium]